MFKALWTRAGRCLFATQSRFWCREKTCVGLTLGVSGSPPWLVYGELVSLGEAARLSGGGGSYKPYMNYLMSNLHSVPGASSRAAVDEGPNMDTGRGESQTRILLPRAVFQHRAPRDEAGFGHGTSS